MLLSNVNEIKNPEFYPGMGLKVEKLKVEG
jgi:hypothetical protein